jgi:hypothetical protein
VIAGNDGTGFFGAGSQIEFSTSSNHLVEGNLIGLGASGHAIAGATGAGIWANFNASAITIGGVTASARNVISGNTTGIQLEGSSNDVIEGDYIGTDPTGTMAIGNGAGNGIQLDNAINDVIGGTVPGRATSFPATRPGSGSTTRARRATSSRGI